MQDFENGKHEEVQNLMWWGWETLSKLCNCEGLNKVWVNLGNVDLIIF